MKLTTHLYQSKLIDYEEFYLYAVMVPALHDMLLSHRTAVHMEVVYFNFIILE